MAQLYLFNLRLNICIDNDSSRGSSVVIAVLPTFFPLAVLIWAGIVTSEAFSLNWFDFALIHLEWYKIQQSKETLQVILKIQFPLISRNSVPSSLFCFSRKVSSKNLPLVLCFVKSNFCWQSAEILLPYHLSSIYAKWLALNSLLVLE